MMPRLSAAAFGRSSLEDPQTPENCNTQDQPNQNSVLAAMQTQLVQQRKALAMIGKTMEKLTKREARSDEEGASRHSKKKKKQCVATSCCCVSPPPSALLLPPPCRPRPCTQESEGPRSPQVIIRGKGADAALCYGRAQSSLLQSEADCLRNFIQDKDACKTRRAAEPPLRRLPAHSHPARVHAQQSTLAGNAADCGGAARARRGGGTDGAGDGRRSRAPRRCGRGLGQGRCGRGQGQGREAEVREVA